MNDSTAFRPGSDSSPIRPTPRCSARRVRPARPVCAPPGPRAIGDGRSQRRTDRCGDGSGWVSGVRTSHQPRDAGGRRADPQARQREDPEVQLLQRRGGLHEQRYIDVLETRGRTVVRGDDDWEHSYEDRAEGDRRADARGRRRDLPGDGFRRPLARLPGLPPARWRTRRAGHSDHHYEVADTKLAHVAKASALIQIASYVEQIERIQGVRPERVYVVTGGARAGGASLPDGRDDGLLPPRQVALRGGAGDRTSTPRRPTRTRSRTATCAAGIRDLLAASGTATTRCRSSPASAAPSARR